TIAPVPPTPEILFLITAAFGLVATVVHLFAVGAGAPAAAGVPLLATFAVPAALADELLPWWAMIAAAAGFGLLLVARRGAHRQLIGGVALVAVCGVLALGLGTAAGFVGTAGRFAGLDASGGSGSSTGVGLSPFAALRGQLTQSSPTQLFEVRGLPRATYLRALTLREFQPESGWTIASPDTGPPLPGRLAPDPRPGGGELAEITITNLAFRDYWLPLYGTPLAVGDLPPDRWTYDVRDSIAYTARPRQEDGWTERALLPAPTLAQLRAADGARPGPEFLAIDRVDPRVGEIAQRVAGDAGTAVDKAVALQEYFSGADTGFTYSLATAPSGGDDALVEFLTVGKRGFCEQYASAMAVMLRTLDVPSRVAIGFTGGTEDGDRRVISTSDAHAWVEAWFPGIGWTTFDPTPLADGRTITPPYVAEALAERDGAAGAAAAEPDPPRESTAPAAAPEPPSAQPPADQVTAGGVPVGLVVTGLVLVVMALVVIAPALLRARQRGLRLAAASAGGPDAVGAAWEELLAESADRGVVAEPSDTVRGTARRMIREHRLGNEAQRALRQLVGTVESSWYGGRHPRAGELAEPVRIVRAAIVAGNQLTVRERVLPRSVLRRPPPIAAAEPSDERAAAGSLAGR
ncbi:MAG: DUF3488 and transglutaminase-like domain-containing protein, partial [Pseudonocardia sp.]|nr:DUF3488 and transglutaminase-like domain-containing protein [Pseudonocardia sp.]